MHRATGIGSLLVLLLASAAPEPGAAQETAVRDVIGGIEDALNARDWAAFGSHFSAEGDAILFESPPAEGPDAVADLMSELWTDMPEDVTATLVATRLRFLTPDVAVVNVRGLFEGSEPSRDRALFVLAHEDERWLIEALRVFPPSRE